MTITIGGVTYVTIREASRLTGVPQGTIRAWVASKAVEAIARGRRRTVYVRLGAVRYTRNTPAAQTRAEGVSRVSPAARRSARAWFQRQQALTQLEADRAFEVWEATEEGRAVDTTDALVVEALRLGRSYGAICARRALVAKRDRDAA